MLVWPPPGSKSRVSQRVAVFVTFSFIPLVFLTRPSFTLLMEALLATRFPLTARPLAVRTTA